MAPACRVLVIDGDLDCRETLCLLLGLWGYDVASAGDCRQGLERSLARKPEVALVDLALPLLDGCGIARQLRAAVGGGLRLVAVTANSSDDIRRQAFEAGFDAFLTKPVDPDVLHGLLAGQC